MEIKHNGKQGAQMDRKIKRYALIRPAGKRWHQNQMGGAGNGEELGDALDNAQPQGLKKVHLSPCSEEVMRLRMSGNGGTLCYLSEQPSTSCSQDVDSIR